ncbi:unnamed protein product [Eruca vesicaria subsp. sativa]|uniref:NAI2-like protein n=1 Tax=Eruca vesicaria subsp. sativa TaxID=29727 RepID=A0ABC8KAA5_ERUVS|nr:unnamed protein product [Eruca vesicaria subsp. sativa]
MTISAMGKKNVVLAVAMCLFPSSFHEVSCQVGGSSEFGTLDSQESESNVQTFEGKATSSVSHSVEAESEAASSYEAGQSSSSLDNIKRLMEGFNKNAGSEAELMDASETGAWRCINPNKDGVKGDDSIVIPKYDLNDIIKEESIKGSSSKTSSLITSLTEIVDNHKKGRWTDVTSEKVKKLKMTLKKYVGIKVRDLVHRSDYEEILTMAALYEELTRAKITYISKLATYGAVIREGFKASQRVKTVHQHVILHENMAIEKQKKVDAEFELVKALAQKGDNLAVQIFAMKKAVLELEAEKKQVEIEFQKIVENFSRILEESSQAYEKHRVDLREWKEVQASYEYSLETVEKADVVWVQFLNTLT